jgi:hypothetical protein
MTRKSDPLITIGALNVKRLVGRVGCEGTRARLSSDSAAAAVSRIRRALGFWFSSGLERAAAFGFTQVLRRGFGIGVSDG